MVLTGAARADTITYFHNDPSGSPVAATDANGNLLWKETYRPYGERLLNGAGPDANRLWFTGKPQDPDTGLSYLGARYYSPQLGRFMGIDPKAVDPGDPHSFNRYAYGNNNPYKFVDPDGRQATLTWCFGGPVACAAGVGLAVITTIALENAIEGTPGILNALHNESAADKEGAEVTASVAKGADSAGTPPGGPDDDGDPEPKRVTNPKHHPNSESPEPKNVDQLYENSVVDKNGVRWAKDADGTIHRFSKPSNGETHWNGSTGGVDPIQPQNIPVQIRRLFGVKG
ncbi:MAG: RHS repeat-associated core domain-containing protein [Candidatus Contendobacter sp.]|nr:RHS repeat-associated core domain-containing protein [Candidatus Contendobacter sp.]